MKISTLIAFLFLITSPVFAQANKIVGLWLTEKGDSQVQIFKNSQGKYSGKIVWLGKNINALDDKNPDGKLKSRRILGLWLLNNFSYNQKDLEWANGSIYDPESGKTYDCYMWLESDNILKVKGYILGMRFMSRQTTWRREKIIRTSTK